MQRTHLGSHSRWYVQNRPQILRSSRILLCLESNSIHPQVPCLPFVGVSSLFQCYADVRAFLPTVTAYVKGLGTVRLIGGQNILHHSNPAECITSCAPSPHRQLLLASRLHFTVHVISVLSSQTNNLTCLALLPLRMIFFVFWFARAFHPTIGSNRETFPWLMTWEENNSRATPPWNAKELCRGLEVSSYAFATSKKENVERGSMFDVPCFEWLDGNESKSTTFYLSLQVVGGPAKTGVELCTL